MIHHSDPHLTTPTMWAAIYAFFAGVTLNEVAAGVGIVVAISTLGLKIYFDIRRDRRDQLRLEYDTGQHDERRVRQTREEDEKDD